MIFATKGYIEFCELQLKQQREDFLERLREKDSEIRRLRAENAGRARIEPIPFTEGAVRSRPSLLPIVDLPKGPLDWQGELSSLLHEEEIPNVV